MKKRNLILLIITAMIFGVFIGYVITNKTNKLETIPEDLELVEMEADKLYKKDSLGFYQSIAKELDIIKIYDSSELTLEILNNRNGKIIIEKRIGKVINKDGDGITLNAEEDYYINYSKVENAEVGNIILSYFIYNPDTNAEDDILLRFDYIIDGTNSPIFLYMTEKRNF